MKIVVIDGQGGGLGRAIVEQVRKEFPDMEIIAVGTNTAASANMLRAGASFCATGENAVIYNSSNADVIIGAVGIAFANAMHGEISPQMAIAVSSSRALKILVPITKCNVIIAGVTEKPMTAYVNDVVDRLHSL